EALRTSEAKYRSLIENLTQAIFLKDRELRIVAVNQPFCQSVGKSAQEILGKTDFELFPEYLAEKHRADDRRVLAEGARLEVEEQRTIDGKTRTVQVVKTPVRDQRGQNVGVLGIFWDVTEQRTLESQFRQAQKMDAIGQLAGGIAHDFNNLLTAIIGNLEMAQMDLPDNHPCREMLGNGLRAGFRAAELTRQLLSFARQTPLRPGPLNLNHSIDETVRMLRRTIDPRIAVETRPDANLWTVQADPAQMGQVLMNLLLNARDAMPEGGTITFLTSNLTLTPETARKHLDGRPGEFVRLAVADTGIGMAPDVREHLFEPFFTTKGPGKGTGLGLAVVFGIIKQHEGWIECWSEPGRGTRFDIFLPRAAIRQAAATDDQHNNIPGGNETILLADDHEMVCRVGREILERLGYQVLTAADGAQALEMYTERARDIHLVILDLSMPKLSGQEVLQQIRKLNPSARVIISSGFYTDQAVNDVASEGAAGFVGKPYRPEELARSVRAALDMGNDN
ncbi:MAG: PAS domain-containing protein, partial [Gemmataceae bacterium]